MATVDVPKKRRIKIRYIVLTLMLCGLFYWLVLSGPINRLILYYQLTSSIDQWRASGIEHYRIVFETATPPVLTKPHFSIIVSHNQIENVLWRPSIVLSDPAYDPETGAYISLTKEQFEQLHLDTYTVEGMYKYAATTLNTPYDEEWHSFEFDSQYHFISGGDGGCYGIGDCGFYYRVIEFEPIMDG